MNTTMLIGEHFTVVRPMPLERLDSKSYYYNFNIRSGVQTQEDEAVDGYYVSVLYIEGEINQARVMRGWLEVAYPMDQELKLLNNYNAFLAGISTDEEKKTEYEAYLKARDDFRQQLALDFETFIREGL